ncbi:hypothetical protein PGTUg99_002552 [Puccinia graminis f. sp. tritici]|uniref:Uncharacterized protein n=1 Tax=Puccinia graminis f. sp. tritici TaxID=56615 RepID=A0A5B0S8E9_PUCGR|nr:hypothetical protein PGTUg99_002552 [Puccinia graminis f. sp. tritici]
MQRFTLLKLLALFFISSHVDCGTYKCPVPNDLTTGDGQQRAFGYCARPVTSADKNTEMERIRLQGRDFFLTQAANFPTQPGVFSCDGRKVGKNVMKPATIRLCSYATTMNPQNPVRPFESQINLPNADPHAKTLYTTLTTGN